MMILTNIDSDSDATTASLDSRSSLQWEIELLEEQVLGISRNTLSTPVEEAASMDVEMLTNEGDQSPTVNVGSCSPDLSLDCSISSSNKNSLDDTLSLTSPARQYYSSGEDNSDAFDTRNIISESKSLLWQHSMEDLLHAETLMSLKTGCTAARLDLSKAIKGVITDQNEMNAASKEMCSNHHAVCGCTKTRDAYLSIHNGSQSGLVVYKCGNCGEKFPDRGMLYRHVSSHMTTSLLYKCDVCELRFENSCLLKLHMQNHKPEDASTARYSNTGRDTCYSDSSSKSSIYECKFSEIKLQRDDEHSKKDHLRSLHYFSVSCKTYKNCFGRLQCMSCPKSFANHHQLKIHAVYHSEPRFKCLVCNKAFYHRYQLQVHKISHTGMPQYACCKCNHTFLGAFNYRMHMRLHTSIRILRRMLQSDQASTRRSYRN
ncbi:hypothetical protein ACJMK2_025365 [Sinanodonta woodiana]|uniref:C2H2-type domain-containing protein n=1 Tax=Sinanodonta woodiana TaxID=1069815 RepID=A0ABD3XI82_SINWO